MVHGHEVGGALERVGGELVDEGAGDFCEPDALQEVGHVCLVGEGEGGLGSGGEEVDVVDVQGFVYVEVERVGLVDAAAGSAVSRCEEPG